MGFPKELRDFANIYVTMQLKRHRCDYSPDTAVSSTEVRRALSATKIALVKFRTIAEPERRAFCAFILLKSRKD